MTVRQEVPHDRLQFTFVPVYDISRITINGRTKEFSKGGSSLTIEDVPHDSVFDVILEYSGVLSFHSDFSMITDDRAVLREEEFLPYTPRILRSVRMSIIVPNGWEVHTAGTLVRRDAGPDSTTFLWTLGTPEPMIGWIVAGKYPVQQTSAGPVPVSVYLDEGDSAAGPRVLDLARKALDFYSRNFLPYRFPKLDIVEVPDQIGGRNILAIAMPSMILVKKLAFSTDDRFNQIDAVLPHEIAHQWWPMTVFQRDEDVGFLSEGLCEFSSLLFAESRGVLAARDSLSHHPMLRALILRVKQGTDTPLQQNVDLRPNPTHYLKGSYTFNMLRRIVGDSVFVGILHQFAFRYQSTRIGLETFVKLCEELSGKRLQWFFDQWVKQRGLPQLKLYNVRAVPEGGRWLTRGRVRMVGYDKYTALVEVAVETPGAELARASVWLGTDSLGAYHNDMPFEVRTAAKPVRAVLDPAGDILKIQKLPPKFSDLHDPSAAIMVVGSRRNADYLAGLARQDSAQMTRGWWTITIKSDTAITLADLQQDHVLLYGKPDENRVVADLEKKFPLRFHGDSAVVNGETVSDSTMSLLQCIDNPYNSDGFLGWIAPFSPHAQPQLVPSDHSWSLSRGKDEIASGTWPVKDDDLVVEIR